MIGNEIYMTLFKKVIDAIVNSIPYICNLSLKTDIFPNK